MNHLVDKEVSHQPVEEALLWLWVALHNAYSSCWVGLTEFEEIH